MWRPYIYVFKWGGKGTYLPDMASYSDQDWNNDYIKILKLYPNSEHIIQKAIQETNITGAIGKLWNVTRVISGDSKKWNTLFRKLGYSGFNDINNGPYHQSEYKQAVFLV